MQPSFFLTGEKIALRGYLSSDMVLYRHWVENPQVNHFLEMGARPLSDTALNDIYKSATERDDTIAFIMVDRTTGMPVGTVGLYQIQWVCRRAQFNILIGEPAAWDKGFGAEAASLLLDYAFDKLNLESVYLGVNAENRRAVRSYEKSGFVHEGTRRKMVYRNGEYYDVHMMSVLREEWLARVKG